MKIFWIIFTFQIPLFSFAQTEFVEKHYQYSFSNGGDCSSFSFEATVPFFKTSTQGDILDSINWAIYYQVFSEGNIQYPNFECNDLDCHSIHESSSATIFTYEIDCNTDSVLSFVIFENRQNPGGSRTVANCVTLNLRTKHYITLDSIFQRPSLEVGETLERGFQKYRKSKGIEKKELLHIVDFSLTQREIIFWIQQDMGGNSGYAASWRMPLVDLRGIIRKEFQWLIPK